MQVDHLTVDSSAFMHRGPIRETGKNIYSCQEILDEIKDKATLESLKFLPYELKLLQFDQDDLNKCIDFSKKTGDYPQLSAVDLKLIAATYSLEKRYNGFKYIHQTPKQVAIKSLESNKKVDNAVIEMPQVDSGNSNDGEQEEEEEEEDEDEGGWITPKNLNEVIEKMGGKKPTKTAKDVLSSDRITVACMTSDFSVQNCLLQMGLMAVSPVDGLMIKHARKIALRCHACLKVFADTSKITNSFCPHCGNKDTLKRVQYSVDKNGVKRVFINFKRPIKVKGTNQQLPRPRGGKHANNPILTADQVVRHDKQKKFHVKEKKAVTADHILHDPAYLVRTNPFVYRSERKR